MEKVSAEEVEQVEAVDGVHLSALAAGERASVQKFRVDPGQEVPTHDHPHEQVGYLVEGALRFVVGAETTDEPQEREEVNGGGEREEVIVEAGESYVLSGGEPHGAINDGDVPAVGIDVFSPPRTDPDWKE